MKKNNLVYICFMLAPFSLAGCGEQNEKPLIDFNFKDNQSSSGLRFALHETGVSYRVTDYISSSSSTQVHETIYIPSTFNGIKVTSIENLSQYQNNSSQKQLSIFIPKTVTSIKTFNSQLSRQLSNATIYTQHEMMPDGWKEWNSSFATTMESPEIFFGVERIRIYKNEYQEVGVVNNEYAITNVLSYEENHKFPSEKDYSISFDVYINNYPVANIPATSLFHNWNVIEARLPESIKTIGGYAFQNAEYLQKINLSQTVEVIHQSAFEGCRSLGDFGITNFPNLTFIGNEAFMSSGIKEMNLADTVRYIGKYAFANSNIQKFIIPRGIDELLDKTFNSCLNLNSIELHDNVKRIGSYVFSNCESLTSIILPRNLQSLGGHSFCNTSLESIFIPSSLMQIENHVFEEMRNANFKIYCETSEIPDTWQVDWNSDDFPVVLGVSFEQYLELTTQ